MTDALLELDFIAKEYNSTQSASTSAFRSLHSAVSDISTRSRKISEATRAHLRALKNVTKTERELNAAISSYTIPDWLVRVGESCSRRPKGDVNCSTSELCKAMSRLVLSKAYLDSKPWNPVADSLGQTVDRYVKNIVAAAEDRVLLRFMNAISVGSSGNGGAASSNVGSPSTNVSPSTFPGSATALLSSNPLPSSFTSAAFESRRQRSHSRTFSGKGHGRTLSTGSEMMGRTGSSTAAMMISNAVSVLFGDSPPADMLEASELLSALFKNYCRIRAVLEVKAHICDQIYKVLENRISEYRRLRIERGGQEIGGGKGLSSFFSSGSSGANLTAPERLARALKELVTNALADSGSNNNNRNKNGNQRRRRGSNYYQNDATMNPDGSSTSLVTLGITDYPECVFGVSKAARDLSLDVSSFLEKYVLSSVPPPPRRKTATEKLLDGDLRRKNKDGDDSPLNRSVQQQKNDEDANHDDENNHDSNNDGAGAAGSPLDPEAADEIDELRSSVLLVPSEIIEVSSTFALELLAKMVSELAVKEIHSLDTAPIFLLEAVQEAWAWRHVAREVCGETEDLLYSIDLKVDVILQKAFDTLANLRDEPSNLSPQSFLDLTLAPRSQSLVSLSFGVLYITGVQALADTQRTNRDRKKLMNWHVDESFRRSSWHPERDLHFGFSPLFVDAIRRMISVHESTLHVVFAGSVDRMDGLIRRADKAIATKQASLIREAKHKNQRNFKQQQNGGHEGGDNSTIDFSNLNLTTMMEAESAAKSVFEYVRADIERFFEESLTNHLNWMSSVASATFLLAHGTFEPDEETGEMTSYCQEVGEEEENNLLWFGIAPGKLRVHPSIFRANTIQKIIRRLSAPGVFDVAPSNQLVWSHETMMNAAVNHLPSANTNTSNNYIQSRQSGTTTRSASSPPNMLPIQKKPDLSAFYSPQSEKMTSSPAGGGGGFDLSLFSTPKDEQTVAKKPSSTTSAAAVSSSASFKQEQQQQENNSSANAATISWRQKVLNSLLDICNEALKTQIDIAAARWATILPNISQNEILLEISDTEEDTPLTHDQRAEVKQWYWKATTAIVDELELWETGVVVIEDAGLKTTMGEAAFDACNKVFEDMKEHVLKGREWSTREHRWFKFPLENLERALRIFRLNLLQKDQE